MEEMITINVWISGRSYRIKINPSEEELVRKGNTTGMVISGFTLGFVILAVALSGAIK